MSALNELWDELDKSAIQLLREAMQGGGTLPTAEGEVTLAPPGGSTLNEKTRVFNAISAYAKTRQDAGPKGPAKPERSGFHATRDEFHRVGSPNGERNPTRRRARAGAQAPEEAALDS